MYNDVIGNISAGRIYAHILQLEGVRHPATNPEALEQAAKYIFAEFSSLKYQVEMPVFNESDREFKNIVATRIGKRYPDERFIIMAHYDTVEASPGADDNASGIAVLLELARIFESIELDRTVQFVAVNLEERQREGPLEVTGMFGSRAFATEAKQQGWKIKGVIVFDAIAYAGEQLLQGKPLELLMNYPERGNFIAVVANTASAELVKLFTSAIQEHQIHLPMVPLVVPGNGEILPETRRSDHSSFWDKGYSAVMLTDTANFRNPHYHQVSDTIDTLNLSFVTQVCRAVAWTIIEAAK